MLLLIYVEISPCIILFQSTKINNVTKTISSDDQNKDNEYQNFWYVLQTKMANELRTQIIEDIYSYD